MSAGLRPSRQILWIMWGVHWKRSPRLWGRWRTRRSRPTWTDMSRSTDRSSTASTSWGRSLRQLSRAWFSWTAFSTLRRRRGDCRLTRPLFGCLTQLSAHAATPSLAQGLDRFIYIYIFYCYRENVQINKVLICTDQKSKTSKSEKINLRHLSELFVVNISELLSEPLGQSSRSFVAGYSHPISRFYRYKIFILLICLQTTKYLNSLIVSF